MMQLNTFLLLLILLIPEAYACGVDEVHVRRQYISSYEKSNGTYVQSHFREEHCRKLTRYNYFSDNLEGRKLKGVFKPKPWTLKEKSIIEENILRLPPWLKEYSLSVFLRASIDSIVPETPATTFPSSKIIVFHDGFFKSKDQLQIIIHEIGHIAIYDIELPSLRAFFLASGWTYPAKGEVLPPKILLKADSQDSPSEDFSNYLEEYYLDKKRLKEFNPLAFQLLEKIIQSREAKK